MSEQAKRTSSDLDQTSFRRMVITRFTGLFIILGAMFFLPVWTFSYWQAWVYMLILVVSMFFIVRYLYKQDPELLKRRLRMRERQKTRKFIQVILWPFFLLAFIIPGFDYRLHRSNVPLAVIIISNVLVLLSYYMGMKVHVNGLLECLLHPVGLCRSTKR